MKKFLVIAGAAAAVVVLVAAYRVVQDNTGRDLWDDVLDGPLD